MTPGMLLMADGCGTRARLFTDDEAAEAPTSVAVFLVNLREVGKPSFEERRTTVQYTPVLNFTNWLLK